MNRRRNALLGAALLLVGVAASAHAWIEVDTAISGTVNTRFDGSDGGAYLANYHLALADLDGNGVDDLLLGETGADPGAKNAAGSLYIIFDDHPNRDLAAPGTTVAMSDPSQYNVRIDGALGGACGGGLGRYLTVADFTGDGENDLMVVSAKGHAGLNCAGALFLISGATFQGAPFNSGTGHILDLSDPTTFVARWDGPTANASFGFGLDQGDLDGDGKLDLAVAAPRSSLNGDPMPIQGGSVYVISGTAIQQLTGTGNTLGVSSSANYDLRYDAPFLHQFLGWAAVEISDLDANGIDDLVIGGQDWTAFTPSGSVYVIRDGLFATQLAGASATPNVALQSSAEWSLRVHGPAVSSLGAESVVTVDFDGNGLQDLVLGAYSHNGSYSGSVYLVLDQHFSTLAGPGAVLELSDPTNWDLRFDAEGADNLLGHGAGVAADFDHDTLPDLALVAYGTPFAGRTAAGAVYVVPRRWIGSNLGPGRVIDLSDPSIDGVVYRGAEAASYQGYRAIASGDWDGDGGDDLIFGAFAVDGPAGAGSGVVYSVVQFPHDLSSTLATTSCGGGLEYVDSSFSINAFVDAPHSLSAIDTAEFLVGDTDPLATWSACTANPPVSGMPSSFDCAVSGLSEGDHTVVVRARDERGTLTPPNQYERVPGSCGLEPPDSHGYS